MTVARGAIGNPWIFQQARALAAGEDLLLPPRLHEQRDVMVEHFRLAEQLYGERRCGQQMRKFGIKYSALHPQHDEVRADFVRVKSFADWKAVLDRWYAEDLPGCFPSSEIHRTQSCTNAA